MKLTKNQLKRLIKEEISKVLILSENAAGRDPGDVQIDVEKHITPELAYSLNLDLHQHKKVIQFIVDLIIAGAIEDAKVDDFAPSGGRHPRGSMTGQIYDDG